MEPDTLTLALDDTPLDKRRGLSSRALLNIVSLGVVVILLGVSARWWLGPAQAAWERVFPPPPYTGPEVYGYNAGGALEAVRLSDGGAQWKLPMAFPELTMQADGILVAGSLQSGVMQGIAAHSGKRLWQMSFPQAVAPQGFASFIGATDATAWTDGVGWLAMGARVDDSTKTATIYAFALQTGRMLWQMAYASSGYTIPVLHNHALIIERVAQGVDHVIAYDLRTKRQMWDTPLATAAPGTGYCQPATSTMVCSWQATDGAPMIAALDYLSGQTQWQITAAGDIVAVSGATLYTAENVAGPDGSQVTLRVYTIATGALRWRQSYTGNSFTYRGLAPVAPDHLPGDAFIVQAPDRYLGVDSATGATRWTWQPQQNTSGGAPAPNWNVNADDRDLVFVGAHDDIYALDAGTDHVRWHTRLIPKSAPGIVGVAHIRTCLYNHATLFCPGDHVFFALAAPNGNVRWQLPYDFSFLGIAA
jgi:outer membrane protein assembly factor BamB